MNAQSEKWAEGDAYEHFMGRWSSDVARLFVDWLPYAAHLSWLDVGCGTGALTRVITSHQQPKTVIGVDPSHDFLRYASQRVLNVRFEQAMAAALPFRNAAFDFIVSGLALNFMPRPELALREFVRVVKPGGIVGAYVWDYAGKMEFLRYFWDAASALNERANTLHEGQRFPICHPKPLQQVWQGAGLDEVTVVPLDVVIVFDDFDRYWQSFTSGRFPAPQYAQSLNDDRREALRARLHETIPTEKDGSLHLIARAWAVRGRKPFEN